MRLHDLKPAEGSRKERTRVGRGIAAGKGKTAGRGTKGQRARGGIPAFFEGGQTPIHIRVPKLRGFKRRFKVEYQVVNVGRIAAYAEAGRFADVEAAGAAASRGRGGTPSLTINAEILRSVGLITNIRMPVKVLGQGDVDRRLFVVADAFTKSAVDKIEAAGGTAQLLRVPPPGTTTPALKAEASAATTAEPAPDAGEPSTAEAPAAPTRSGRTRGSAATSRTGSAETAEPRGAETVAAGTATDPATDTGEPVATGTATETSAPVATGAATETSGAAADSGGAVASVSPLDDDAATSGAESTPSADAEAAPADEPAPKRSRPRARKTDSTPDSTAE